MQKLVLVSIVVSALVLTLFANLGDAQVMASVGACVANFADSAKGQAFCKTLEGTKWSWSIVFNAGIVMAGLGVVALYLHNKHES